VIKLNKILDVLKVMTHKQTLNFCLEDLKRILSNRQWKVVKLKSKDYINIEIAKELGVCPATITNDLKKIRKNILEDRRKLNCQQNKK